MNYSGIPERLRDEWRTPRRLFDLLNREVQFTIDAAATAENALCDRFWSQADNALHQSWLNERIYCNPPYSEIGLWVAKAHASLMTSREHGGKVCIYMLLRSDLSTRWFHSYVFGYAQEIIAIQPRVQFDPPIGYEGVYANTPTFGSIVAVYAHTGRAENITDTTRLTTLDWITGVRVRTNSAMEYDA